MKNSINLCFILLALIGLACNCGDRLKELSKKGEQTPPPPAVNTKVPESEMPVGTKGEYLVTMERYERVKIGMKKGDVENIFGGKGEEYYSGTGGGVSFTSVKWVGEKYKTVLVSFKNDKVTSKSQVGLNK